MALLSFKPVKMKESEIRNEVKELIAQNIESETFKYAPYEFDCSGAKILWDQLPSYLIKVAENELSIQRQRIEARTKLTSPEVGDFLKRKDGSCSRITHIHTNTTQAGGGSERFYMEASGRASYSGGLNPGIPNDSYQLTDQTREAMFWHFADNRMGANRGISFKCPAKVWEEI